MKKSRFTEEQIAFALKQAETGTRIDEICRKMGISDATFYKWRQKYGGLGPSELRKLKQLEDENSKLKGKSLKTSDRPTAEEFKTEEQAGNFIDSAGGVAVLPPAVVSR